MRTFITVLIVGSAALVAGFVGGWFARPAPKFVGLTTIVVPGDPAMTEAPPLESDFEYPNAALLVAGQGDSTTTNDLTYGHGNYRVSTTADSADAVLAHYTRLLSLPAPGGSGSSGGGSTSVDYGITRQVVSHFLWTYTAKQPDGFAFGLENARFTIFGTIIRPAGANKTTITIYFRPNREFQSLLKAGAKS
jgi:hypothetical protein